MNRRRFVQSSVAGGLTLAVTPRALLGQAPTVMSSKSAKPVVIASANGNKFKNGGDVTCVQKAFTMMTQGGADVLDALIAGVNIVELDPLDDSVGYGGLPNAEGVVQLDSCCMHGPKRRAGGVAEIEGVRAPSKVAQMVMDLTDHHLIVGKGAQDFARSMGVTIESDLNTENSRRKWLEWKRRTDPLHYLSPKDREQAYRQVARDMIVDEMRRGAHPKDAALTALKRVAKNTVEKRLLKAPGQPNFGLNFYCLNAKGEYAGVAMYESTYAVCTENGPQTVKTDALFA